MPVTLKAPALYEHVAPAGQLVMVWPVRLVVSMRVGDRYAAGRKAAVILQGDGILQGIAGRIIAAGEIGNGFSGGRKVGHGDARCGVVVAGIVVGDRPGNAQARCVTDNTGCRRDNGAGYGVSHRSAKRQVGSSAHDVRLHGAGSSSAACTRWRPGNNEAAPGNACNTCRNIVRDPHARSCYIIGTVVAGGNGIADGITHSCGRS